MSSDVSLFMNLFPTAASIVKVFNSTVGDKLRLVEASMDTVSYLSKGGVSFQMEFIGSLASPGSYAGLGCLAVSAYKPLEGSLELAAKQGFKLVWKDGKMAFSPLKIPGVVRPNRLASVAASSQAVSRILRKVFNQDTHRLCVLPVPRPNIKISRLVPAGLVGSLDFSDAELCRYVSSFKLERPCWAVIIFRGFPARISPTHKFASEEMPLLVDLCLELLRLLPSTLEYLRHHFDDSR